MPVTDIDFEGNGGGSQTQQTEEEVTQLHGDTEKTDIDKNPETTETQEQNGENSSTGELEEGTQVEFDGNVYTVDANHNLVDSDGKIFKEASEVDAWLKENNAEEEKESEPEFSIQGIQEALGVEIKDENGNPVEFTNDAEGVKSYVNGVMELRAKEISEATLNKFFDDAPIVREFIDYLTVNNGNPQGFGQLRDRSGVKLDKDNEAQQEFIIRAAAKEFGNTTINDNYISYLKDTGALFKEAETQLNALIEKDKAAKKEMADKAQQAREEDQKRVAAYWAKVNDVVESRNIAGYKIPESFVLEKNGQKITQTPSDFMNYLTRQNRETGRTGYQTDLDNMSEDEVLHAELLDAWLHYTGKTYKDLINMAVKEENVRRLVVKSKEAKTSKSVKIVRKPGGKTNINDIVLE